MQRIAKDVTEFKVEYAKNPGALKGTKTINNSDGSVTIITWDSPVALRDWLPVRFSRSRLNGESPAGRSLLRPIWFVFQNE